MSFTMKTLYPYKITLYLSPYNQEKLQEILKGKRTEKINTVLQKVFEELQREKDKAELETMVD